jgi:hypothetical protein
MPTAAALLTLAKKHVGEKYVFGATVPKDNPDWKGPWDCAEFASWLVFQATGQLFGCISNSADPSVAESYSGAWWEDANKRGTRLSVEDAIRTPGAFLIRPPAFQSVKVGHVALSDGLGGTVEAKDTASGVVTYKSTGRTWAGGVIVPGLVTAIGGAVAAVPMPKTLKVGDSGAAVGALQTALAAKGFSPGKVDKQYGPHTWQAVCAWQAAHGLTVDGIAGPQTLGSLGL